MQFPRVGLLHLFLQPFYSYRVLTVIPFSIPRIKRTEFRLQAPKINRPPAAKDLKHHFILRTVPVLRDAQNIITNQQQYS